MNFYKILCLALVIVVSSTGHSTKTKNLPSDGYETGEFEGLAAYLIIKEGPKKEGPKKEGPKKEGPKKEVFNRKKIGKREIKSLQK